MRALLALWLVACTLPALESPQPSAVEHAIEHTIYLEGPGCTAVELANHLYVTAKHCIPLDASTGDAYEGGVIETIGKADFASFRRPGLGLSAVRYRSATIGEHVYAVGYPVQLYGGQELTVTDGVFAGPTDSQGRERITAPIYFGNSGGGVWGADGCLVGISVATFAYAVPEHRPIPYEGQGFMVPIGIVVADL